MAVIFNLTISRLSEQCTSQCLRLLSSSKCISSNVIEECDLELVVIKPSLSTVAGSDATEKPCVRPSI